MTIMTTPTSFKEAYQILKDNATRLENSDVLDVDTLVHTVEESINAYKVCQARILAVEQALERVFSETCDNQTNTPNTQP